MKMKPQHTQTYGTQWRQSPWGKHIVLSAAKKKLEKAYTSSLTAHLKALEQKEANSPKMGRGQEIIKLRGKNQPSKNKKNYRSL